MSPAPNAKFVALAKPDGEPDDLTEISGIGPSTRTQLNQAGVWHFSQLAALGDDDIADLEKKVGGKAAALQSWREQAQAKVPPAPPPGAQTLEQRTPAPADAAQDKPEETAKPAAPAAPATKANKRGADTVVVKTKRASRRRAGMTFTKGETRFPIGNLTLGQLEALEKDPALDVSLETAGDE